MNDDGAENHQHDPAERLYAYNQSSQLEAQTGCIGHLRGDFGGGQEFYTSWFDHRGEYKTDEFKAEFDEVVNTLREKNGLLCTRDSMTRFCQQNPEAEMVGNYCAEYGFKLQTVQHTYMLRSQSQLWRLQLLPLRLCCPIPGTPHGKGQTGYPVYHARLQGAVPHSRRRPHPHFHWRRRNPRPHLPVHRRNPF